MIISSAAMAGGYNDHYFSQPTNGRQTNPWALPQAVKNPPVVQQPLKYQNQQNQQYQQYQQYQESPRQNKPERQAGDRFVTPEFLDSLKRQQTQMQMMPEDGRIRQFAPQRSEPDFSGPGPMVYPSCGMGAADPLYDTPVVTPWTPWGIGSDVW